MGNLQAIITIAAFVVFAAQILFLINFFTASSVDVLLQNRTLGAQQHLSGQHRFVQVMETGRVISHSSPMGLRLQHRQW